ncbi:MAG: translation initiation factor IF-2 N-terminal domain-containing protein, partial [Enterococcus italicus]
MGKKRIYELAKELNTSNKSLVEKAQSLGFDVANHMGTISETQEKQLRQSLQPKKTEGQTKSTNPTNTPEPKFQSQRNNPKFQNRKNQAPRINTNNRGTKGATGNAGNRMNSTSKVETKDTKPTQAPIKPTPTENKGTDQRPNTGQAKANQTNRPQNRNTNQGRNSENMNQNKPTATSKPKNNAPRDTKSTAKPAAQKSQTTNRPAQTATRPAKPATKFDNASNNGQDRNKPANRSNNRNKNNNFGNNQNRSKFNKRGKKGRQNVSQERKPAVPARKFRELPDVLEYTEGMNVAEIAKKIHREPAEIIKKLFMLGVMVNQNQPLDKDTIELLATDYG